MGWYAALPHIRASGGDPKQLERELILYKLPLVKAGLFEDDNQAE
jgi:hypothetical protein